MNTYEDHRVQAERHVVKGEQRVAEQRMLIARLRENGQDVTDAELFLVTLEQSLAAMRAHLQQILDERT